jgi:hypothetical protein
MSVENNVTHSERCETGEQRTMACHYLEGGLSVLERLVPSVCRNAKESQNPVISPSKVPHPTL